MWIFRICLTIIIIFVDISTAAAPVPPSCVLNGAYYTGTIASTYVSGLQNCYEWCLSDSNCVWAVLSSNTCYKKDSSAYWNPLSGFQTVDMDCVANYAVGMSL